LNANDMLHDTVSCTSVASLFENCHHKQLNVVQSLSPFIWQIDQGDILGPPCHINSLLKCQKSSKGLPSHDRGCQVKRGPKI
jgi:hypothetical protein